MTQFVAFLRGVNVGKHNRLKTKDLCQRLMLLGLKNVSGYKQSGNVLFEAPSEDTNAISRSIQEELRKLVENNVEVFLRTIPQLKGFVKADPFKGINSDTTKTFVTFMSDKPAVEPSCPIKSPKMDVEVILVRDREAFSLSYLRNDDRFGDPNGFIEATFKVSATTRNWNTIEGIAAVDWSKR